ncbi:MAG: PHP domain-containing protein, partial [Thermomicrobiales bacterium]
MESDVVASHIDLHTHTTASDGLLAPADLVSLASQRGLSVLGITDHDTIDGLTEALVHAREIGLTVVPGVELSTSIGGHEVHVLGYFVDPGDPHFLA